MTAFADLIRKGVLPDPTGRDSGVAQSVTVLWDFVPVALQTAGLAALQTLGAAGNLTLAAGTGVTSRVGADGNTYYDLDVPRCVTLTSAGNISGVTFTITGLDTWGNTMVHQMAGPNANTVATTKAFKSVLRIAASGAVGTNTSVGFNDKFGLPYRVTDKGYMPLVFWNGASDAGTFVAGDQTDPATNTTTDPRGCYTPASAADGTKRLVAQILLPNSNFSNNFNYMSPGLLKLFRGVTQ